MAGAKGIAKKFLSIGDIDNKQMAQVACGLSADLSAKADTMDHGNTKRKFIKHVAIAGLAAACAPLTGCAPISAVAQAPGAIALPAGRRILFQGDSITDGNRGRNADPNHILGHGYAFAVASRTGADFPQAGFAFFNRGVSGNRIPDLQRRWQVDTLDLRPDVLSLLIGINDTGASVNQRADAQTVEQFEKGYRGLLEDCRAANPSMLFVLGLPFVLPVGPVKGKWEAWRDGVGQRTAVIKTLAAQFDAVVVDYQAMFDAATQRAGADYWIWDGIHPTVFGHELMAREWIRQVAKRWPFLRHYQY